MKNRTIPRDISETITEKNDGRKMDLMDLESGAYEVCVVILEKNHDPSREEAGS